MSEIFRWDFNSKTARLPLSCQKLSKSFEVLLTCGQRVIHIRPFAS
jgi:hypothetical protein